MHVLTAQGWYWDPLLNGTIETSFLLGLKVNRMSTTLHTVRMLNGCLFNQYALDIFEEKLCVALTILSFWSIAVVDENSAFPKQQLIF